MVYLPPNFMRVLIGISFFKRLGHETYVIINTLAKLPLCYMSCTIFSYRFRLSLSADRHHPRKQLAGK